MSACSTTTRIERHGLYAYCRSFFFQAEDGIRDYKVTGVQTCALPISSTKQTATELPRAARGRKRCSAQSVHPAHHSAISATAARSPGTGARILATASRPDRKSVV